MNDDMYFDENEINELESRIDLIHTLKRKYGNSIEEILIYKDSIEAEINRINNLDEENEKLKNELEQVVRNASLKIGINEVIIEKDYWVCFVLNYLFSKCKWKDAFTFKGGTSLSKCFHLIQRFSEDIDLILDWRVIGYSVDFV